MLKKTLSVIVRIAVSVGLLGILAFMYRDTLPEVHAVFSRAYVPLIAISFILTIGVLFFLSVRLRIALAVQEVCVTAWDAFRVVCLGMFAVNFVPSMIGGDAVKAVYLSSMTKRLQASIVGTFIDRIFGLIALIGLALVCLFFSRQYFDARSMVVFVGACVACIGCAALFFANPQLARIVKPLVACIPFAIVREKGRDLYYALHAYARAPRAVVKILSCAVLIQVGHFSLVYLLARALHVDIGFPLFLLNMTIISLAQLAPSINGLGVREAMFVMLFESHCGAENALAIALLMDLMMIFMGMSGGVVFALWGRISFRELMQMVKVKKEEKSNEPS